VNRRNITSLKSIMKNEMTHYFSFVETVPGVTEVPRFIFKVFIEWCPGGKIINITEVKFLVNLQDMRPILPHIAAAFMPNKTYSLSVSGPLPSFMPYIWICHYSTTGNSSIVLKHPCNNSREIKSLKFFLHFVFHSHTHITIALHDAVRLPFDCGTGWTC